MFYNELLIKGVDLLKPLPWHLSHLCSGGVPESAGHTQRLEQTHALVQGVKFAVDTTISTLVLCQFIQKSGQGSKPTTCCYQDTTKPKWSKGLPTACFQLPRNPHKDIQSIMTFVYGWRTQNTTPSYHFYGSLDTTVFSKQYRRALSTSNISILTNFYQNFLWRNQKLSTRSEKLWTPLLLNPGKSNPLFGLDCPFLFRGTAHWFVPFSETLPKKPKRKLV